MPELWDGFARLVRPVLGITAFGVNVMNLPPDYETAAHDARESVQEELYVALAGSGAVIQDDGGDRLPFDPDRAVRVASETRRALSSGRDGLRVLIVGGTPGQAYVAPDWSSSALQSCRPGNMTDGDKVGCVSNHESGFYPFGSQSREPPHRRGRREKGDESLF